MKYVHFEFTHAQPLVLGQSVCENVSQKRAIVGPVVGLVVPLLTTQAPLSFQVQPAVEVLQSYSESS